MSTEIIPVMSAIVGSSALTAAVTNWLNRRRAGAETTEILVRSALALESQATQRFASATEALSAAQAALTSARLEIDQLESYIDALHDLLQAAGIPYPPQPSVYGGRT